MKASPSSRMLPSYRGRRRWPWRPDPWTSPTSLPPPQGRSPRGMRLHVQRKHGGKHLPVHCCPVVGIELQLPPPAPPVSPGVERHCPRPLCRPPWSSTSPASVRPPQNLGTVIEPLDERATAPPCRAAMLRKVLGQVAHHCAVTQPCPCWIASALPTSTWALSLLSHSPKVDEPLILADPLLPGVGDAALLGGICDARAVVCPHGCELMTSRLAVRIPMRIVLDSAYSIKVLHLHCGDVALCACREIQTPW